MREVIARMVTARVSRIPAGVGTTLVCGYAHSGLQGRNPRHNGVLFNDSALKGTHFMSCATRTHAAAVPANITGFMVGREYEQRGITKTAPR